MIAAHHPQHHVSTTCINRNTEVITSHGLRRLLVSSLVASLCQQVSEARLGQQLVVPLSQRGATLVLLLLLLRDEEGHTDADGRVGVDEEAASRELTTRTETPVRKPC
jgi:hypothetical protein